MKMEMKMNRFSIQEFYQILPVIIFLLLVTPSFCFFQSSSLDTSDSTNENDTSDVIDPSNRCNRTIDIYRTVSEPVLGPENRGQPITCIYRVKIRPVRDDWIISIRFTRMKVGIVSRDRSKCHGGYLQIVDGKNGTLKRNPGFFCGEIDSPKTYISESSSLKIVFHSDSYSEDDYFQFYVSVESSSEFHSRLGHQEHNLHPNRRGVHITSTYCDRYFENCNIPGHCYLQSPGFPEIYPRNLKCRYLVKSKKNLIGLDIISLDVDGQECDSLLDCSPRPVSTSVEECSHDYIRIYDGNGETTSPLITTLCGRGRLSTSIIASGSEMLLEFVTSPAAHLINTGFQMKAESVFESGDSEPIQLKPDGSCVITRQINSISSSTNSDPSLQLIFPSSPSLSSSSSSSSSSSNVFTNIRSWYPINTTCSYHFYSSDPEDKISLHFLWFRIDRVTLCQESISIYDSNQPEESKLMNQLCDSNKPMGGASKSSYVSSGPELLVQFHSQTGSLSGSSINYGIDIKRVPKTLSSNNHHKLCND